MVYCGKPSKGCLACRSRKTRCDRATPSCSQCIRAKRECPGYRNQLDLMFRNENQQSQAVIGKVITQKNRKQKTSATNAKSSRKTSPSYISDVRTDVTKTPVQIEREHEIFLPLFNQNVPGSLSPTIEDRALGFYKNREAIWLRNFDLVETICNQTNTDEYLLASLKAVGLASYAASVRSPKLMTRARRDYGQALLLTNAALRSPTEYTKDSTLFAVVSLGVFETIAGNGEESLTAWAKHLVGAAELVKLRGPAQFRTEAGQRMFFQICSNLMVDSVQYGKTMSPYLLALRAGAKPYINTQDPAWRISEGILDFTYLRSNAIHKLVGPRQIVEHALKIDAYFVEVVDQMPPIWRPKRYYDDKSPEAIWNKTYIVHTSFWIAQMQNTMRVFRIHCHQIIREQIASLSSDFTPVFSEEEAAELRSKSLKIMYTMQEEILSSIPQYAPYGISDFPSKLPHEPWNAYHVLWPLFLCGNMDITTPQIEEWVLNRYRVIAKEGGIDHASVLAQSMVTRRSQVVWEGTEEREFSHPLQFSPFDWQLDGWALAHTVILAAQINKPQGATSPPGLPGSASEASSSNGSSTSQLPPGSFSGLPPPGWVGGPPPGWVPPPGFKMPPQSVSNASQPQSNVSSDSQVPPTGYSGLPPAGWTGPPPPGWVPPPGFKMPPTNGASKSKKKSETSSQQQAPPAGYSGLPPPGWTGPPPPGWVPPPGFKMPPSNGANRASNSNRKPEVSNQQQEPSQAQQAPPAGFSGPPPPGWSGPPPPGWIPPPGFKMPPSNGARNSKRNSEVSSEPQAPPQAPSQAPPQAPPAGHSGPPPGWTGPPPPGWVPPPGFQMPPTRSPKNSNMASEEPQTPQPARHSGLPPPGWTGPPPPGWVPPPGFSMPPVNVASSTQNMAYPTNGNESNDRTTPPHNSQDNSPSDLLRGPPAGWTGPPPPGWNGQLTPSSSSSSHNPFNASISPDSQEPHSSKGPPPGWTGPPPPGWNGQITPSSSSSSHNPFNASVSSDSQEMPAPKGPPPGWTGPPPSGWDGRPSPPFSSGSSISSSKTSPTEERSIPTSSRGPPPGWVGPPPSGWTGQLPPSSGGQFSQIQMSVPDASPKRNHPQAPPGWRGPPPPGWNGQMPPSAPANSTVHPPTAKRDSQAPAPQFIPEGWVGPPPPGWNGQMPPSGSSSSMNFPSSGRTNSQVPASNFIPEGWVGPPPPGWNGQMPPSASPNPMDLPQNGRSDYQAPASSFIPEGWVGPPPPGWNGQMPPSM